MRDEETGSQSPKPERSNSSVALAITLLDETNGQDPRSETWQNRTYPRELIFALRVDHWVRTLVHQPSIALLLAARAHTLRRWLMPRDRFPKGPAGYHAWRDALAGFHAEQADPILIQAGLGEFDRLRVRDLILRTEWPNDPEARTLEDADCLAFLELKLGRLADAWSPEETERILRSTWIKMSPAAQALTGSLDVSPTVRGLLQRVVNPG